MPEAAPPSIALVLQQLALANGSALVAVAQRQDDDFLIEESGPVRRLDRVRLPSSRLALMDGSTTCIDTTGIRLPLAWTLACDGRPDHIAAIPLGVQSRYLIVAGPDQAPPVSALTVAAKQLAKVLAAGQGTQRDLTLALQIRDLVDHLPFPVVFIDSRSFDALINGPARPLLGLSTGSDASAYVHIALRRLMAESGVDPALAFSPDATEQVFDLIQGEEQYEVTIRTIERERLAGRLWVFRNVTAEREAARFKDELIANVSHELRTPLTSIVGALSLLKGMFGATASPDAGRLLTIADNNAARLGRLVDDLLDAGRIEAGHLEIAPRPVDLGWLVADAVELNRPYADRLGVTLAFARPRRRCVAQIDPDRMTQVLGNLLSNAAKFSPRGHEVSVALETAATSARIRIVDQGIGMTPEFQQRLFTRFVRERSDAGRAPGTGLGLTIAKGLVEAMGGSIAISSALGKGTTVTIELPLEGAAQAR